MKRRDFLKKTAALAALTPALSPALAGCESDVSPDGNTADASGVDGGASDGGVTAPLPTYEFDGTLGPETLFSHGVASGDPMADRVILWTRVTTAELAEKPEELDVFWEIASDDKFADRANAGTTKTSKERDWTVKVDADLLAAGQTYFYRFWLQGQGSTVGRTKTAPTGEVSSLRFGVCSCARYAAGFYVGYRALAKHDDLDAVLHLGDYMYESGGGGARPNDPPHETVTLSDYRRRYAHQRKDGDLQLLHATHPMIAVWDDHETANNSHRDGAGQGGHDAAKQGPWKDRKEAGIAAWHEWMPVREAADRRIWRTLSYGALLDLVMLDTRLWGRDPQTTGGNKAALADEKRSNMGMDQEAWLADQLKTSKAKWVVLGQQVMCAPLLLGGVVLNTDQWDGYQASRKRLFDAIDARGRGDVVVLTGDIHSSWASELVMEPEGYEPGSGKAWGVEFVTPGITSSFPPSLPKGLVEGGVKSNPHIRWFELGSKGYYVLNLDAKHAQADWYFYTDISKPTTESKYGASWRVAHGTTVLEQVDKPVG